MTKVKVLICIINFINVSLLFIFLNLDIFSPVIYIINNGLMTIKLGRMLPIVAELFYPTQYKLTDINMNRITELFFMKIYYTFITYDFHRMTDIPAE